MRHLSAEVWNYTAGIAANGAAAAGRPGGGEIGRRELIIETNERACNVFRENLAHNEAGAAGLEYLRAHGGLSDATLQQFRLGFRRMGGPALVTAAGARG